MQIENKNHHFYPSFSRYPWEETLSSVRNSRLCDKYPEEKWNEMLNRDAFNMTKYSYVSLRTAPKDSQLKTLLTKYWFFVDISNISSFLSLGTGIFWKVFGFADKPNTIPAKLEWHFQVIEIETSHFSCPIRFEQPTKFSGPSGCVSCSRFGSLIF